MSALLDTAAEKALALTLVQRPEAWDYCADLSAEMFAEPMARSVFEAVRSLVYASKPVTPVTVQAEMDKGGSVIPKWANAPAGKAEDVPTLAARVRDLWNRRELQSLGAWLSEYAEKEDSGSLVAEVVRVQNRTQRGGGKYRSMAQMVHDLVAEEQTAAAKGRSRYVFETGFSALDRMTGGFRAGELVVIGARPGAGKTTVVMNLMANFADAGVPCAGFWLEDEWRDATRRYLAARCRIPIADLRHGPVKAVNAIAESDAAEVAATNLFIDDTHGLTIDDVCARMRRLSREQGVRVFVLDHVGELRIGKDQAWGDRHDLALGSAVRQYRDCAKDLDAVPVLCSQMNRAIEKRGKGAKPQLSDLEGSGGIEQAARIAMFVSNGEAERSVHGFGGPAIFLDLVKQSSGVHDRAIALAWFPELMRVTNP